jgi:predicted metalloprotease
MRWEGREGSSNIEDRRGMRIPGGRGGGFGCIGLLVVLGISLLTGADPRALLGILGLVEQVTQQQAPPAQEAPAGQAREGDPQAQFIGVVLKDTENAWNAIFQKSGKRYQEPTLVLFEGRVSSACGLASAAVGPFYCPLDSKIYLDLAFFRELDRRFGAPGDFAQAYVIAHEVGHHVQNLLGISQRMQEARGRLSEAEVNQLSVRLELQADFFAGVWAHDAQEARQLLESGDLEEAITAAGAIGDDRLQRESQGAVIPDSFTHGTSEQRIRWFRRGFETGDLSRGDTFNAPSL